MLDSSSTEIQRTSLDGEKGKPFSFTYVLNHQDIPAGVLTLKVVVKDSAKDIVHTGIVSMLSIFVSRSEDSFPFVVHPQMIASNLRFSGDKTQYQIGDKVEVSRAMSSSAQRRGDHGAC